MVAWGYWQLVQRSRRCQGQIPWHSVLRKIWQGDCEFPRRTWQSLEQIDTGGRWLENQLCVLAWRGRTRLWCPREKWFPTVLSRHLGCDTVLLSHAVWTTWTVGLPLVSDVAWKGDCFFLLYLTHCLFSSYITNITFKCEARKEAFSWTYCRITSFLSQ